MFLMRIHIYIKAENRFFVLFNGSEIYRYEDPLGWLNLKMIKMFYLRTKDKPLLLLFSYTVNATKNSEFWLVQTWFLLAFVSNVS